MKMSKRKINIGDTFGKLTVLERLEDVVKPYRKLSNWKCKCECGNTVKVLGKYLLDGHVKSCGCYRKQVMKDKCKKYNKWEFMNDYVIGYSDKGDSFFIDIEDYERVKDIYWFKDSKNYIRGIYNGNKVRLHRFIMNAPDDMLVDHIHGEETRNDNRKSNLRIGTNSQNQMNKNLHPEDASYVAGVRWSNKDKKWISFIGLNNKHIYLGSFNNKEDAIKVRKEAEDKYFGEWSYNNSQNL